MRKILICTGLLAVLLLPGTPGTAESSRSRFTALFCPECWSYLVGHGALDLKGNCENCGKYPLELEVQTMRWYWCEAQLRWLVEPCARHDDMGFESLATVTRSGPTLERAAYCPEHRSFTGVALPFIKAKACPVDLKPMTAVWATRRTWFWCESEGQWAASPCPMDSMKHCCTPRTGLLVATPEPGPLAEE